MPQFYTVAACVFLSLSERSAFINNPQTSWVDELYCSKGQQRFIKKSEKHDRKLRHLLGKRSPVRSGSSLKDKWVMNLSSKQSSALERSGLEKGLKFAIAPSKIPTAETDFSTQRRPEAFGKSWSKQHTQAS